MVKDLTPQQREEVQSAANCALIGKLPESVIAAIHAAGMSTADVATMCTDAALPVIWRVCLEEAAAVADERVTNAVLGSQRACAKHIADALRALAEETR